MNIFKQIIPVAIVAVPMLGMASGSEPAISAHQTTTALADSDTVSVGTVVDEVVWVVGDEAILKSDIEAMRLQAAMEGVKWNSCTEIVQASGHYR